jgi:hypothetical protein
MSRGVDEVDYKERRGDVYVWGLISELSIYLNSFKFADRRKGVIKMKKKIHFFVTF